MMSSLGPAPRRGQAAGRACSLFSAASRVIRSTSSKFGQKFSGSKRDMLRRQSLSARSLMLVVLAVRNSRPSGLYAHEATPEARRLVWSNSPSGLLDSGFRLERSDWMHALGALDSVGCGFGQAKVTDLNQLGDGTNGILDRCRRINAVLIVKVDHVDLQPAQGCFAGQAHIVRLSIDAHKRAIRPPNMPNLVASTTWSR